MGKSKKLGKYELLEELGRGGFGTVYRANETILDVERAVKVLHPMLVSDPEFIARFRREARLSARLEHPNIVPVYELGEQESAYYLAMRYMPGGSLKDLLHRDGKLSFQRALEILRQISEALDYAHQVDLVHRDIKPANILFETTGAARVGDFGFAKSLAGAGSASLSASGGLIGTPPYMSPEVWRGEKVTSSTDVYSLACLFYEMVTGEVLFEGESPPEVMTKHMLDGPKFLDEIEDGLPEGMTKILEKALEKDPGKRYQDAGSFYQQIYQLTLDEKAILYAQTQAGLLVGEAQTLLGARRYEEAVQILKQAANLVPDDPTLAPQLEQAQEALKIENLYKDALTHYQAAKENAQEVLSSVPNHHDPNEIFPVLGLRDKITFSEQDEMSSESNSQPRWHENIMPYLLIFFGLATSWIGIGIIGLVAGIGLFFKKEWARITGMVYAGLLEGASIVATIWAIEFLTGRFETVNSFETYELIFPIMIACVLAFALAVFFYIILNGPRMRSITNGQAGYPVGLYLISVGFLSTGFGIPFAVILLQLKRIGLIWARLYTFLLALSIPIFAYQSTQNMYYVIHRMQNGEALTNWYLNDFGILITWVMATLFFCICVRAFFYLRSKKLKTYFNNVGGSSI